MIIWIIGMSGAGKKWKFPIFIQKFIHRMSVIGGKAELFRGFAEVRKVPIGDFQNRLGAS